ncbi:hypothetical protein Ancab_001307 [Ancistrocladus abbreviatus]
MEQCSPFGWFYYNEEEGMSDLKQFVIQTRMELETTILSAQEEISRKEEELIHLKDLLMLAVKDRDDALSKCQKLLLENLSLQQQLQQQKLQKAASFSRITTSNEEKHKVGVDTTTNTSFSSSESEESIISSPAAAAATTEHINPQNPFPNSSLPPPQITLNLANKRPLPEKGKLLRAVMEAGPLLQTLLLAGPLPQWQHPPPQLDPIEIPPVTIPSPTPPKLLQQDSISSLSKKRGPDNNFDGSVSSSSCKYQRVVSH